ncbi:MAG TPA: PhnD/SsuA/transferrin family substrate-binding protein [Burkholderiales bacterium]|nr:PhnD/SsuA/transferrin family substrate-binding protein [Burkholderiales bacterium]
MAEARVQFHGADYEHVLGLSGKWHGIDIEYVTVQPPRQIFERMLEERCYECCEFSLANYIMLRDRGADWLHAIPVFPYRAFRHSTLYVRRDSPMKTPADLRGKRVGVPDYSMTAAVWTRGILKEQYGVDWADMRWVSSGRQRFEALPGASVELVNSDLEADLIAGRIDALFTPNPADETKPEAERQLRSLIGDVQQAEEDYVRDFGVYPINHVVVIRDDALARLPDLPRALFDAFRDAKSRAYQRRLGTTLMPWGTRHWNKVFDMFGGDPLPYGLDAVNRVVVQRLADYLFDQKLISKNVDIEGLFIPQTLKFGA